MPLDLSRAELIALLNEDDRRHALG